MKTISILCFNRPYYLQQCLEALAKCRGVEQYHLFISVDGGGSEVIAPQGIGQTTTIIHQGMNYGINEHNFTAFEMLFRPDSKVDFNVALEDDAVLSPDALELAEWFYTHPRRDEYLFCALGKISKDGKDFDYQYIVDERANISSSHAWCFTRAAWDLMRENWNSKKEAPVGWDFSLAMQMYLHGWRSLTPRLSRVKTVGRIGVNSTAEWFDANVAGQVVSDGSKSDFEITNRLPDGWNTIRPEWMSENEWATARPRSTVI